ncbi:MAG: hypothetical protein ACOX5G_07350 [Kiritimatiellia bacterium]|jgi:uncharacterized Zn finger protein
MSRKKHFAPRIPLIARGGIRSQTRRSSAARPWWGDRWIRAFEALRPGARLGRGRNYAVSGQVTLLEFSPGRLDARVQGGRDTPYALSVEFAALDAAAARRIATRLRGNPLLLARILTRELPRRLQRWFEEEGVPLFPAGPEDMRTRCDCPDWSHVCKHVAAAYLLFGEAMEQDPALLLRLRGLDMPEFAAFDAGDAARPAAAAESPPQPEPAPSPSPDRFWNGAPPTAAPGDFGPVNVTGESAPLARRLGPLPFWRGLERFEDTLVAVARRALPAGWRAWTGEKEPPPPSATTRPTDASRPRRGPPRIDVTALP